MRVSQAHKLHDRIHDIELSTMDATTVGEVMYVLLPLLSIQARTQRVGSKLVIALSLAHW